MRPTTSTPRCPPAASPARRSGRSSTATPDLVGSPATLTCTKHGSGARPSASRRSERSRGQRHAVEGVEGRGPTGHVADLVGLERPDGVPADRRPSAAPGPGAAGSGSPRGPRCRRPPGRRRCRRRGTWRRRRAARPPGSGPSARTPRRCGRAPPPRARRLLTAVACVVPLHGGVDPVGHDGLDGVGGVLDGDVELGALALPGPPQDVVGAVLAARRLADADAHAGELVGAHVGLDRAEAVVAGEARRRTSP